MRKQVDHGYPQSFPLMGRRRLISRQRKANAATPLLLPHFCRLSESAGFSLGFEQAKDVVDSDYRVERGLVSTGLLPIVLILLYHVRHIVRIQRYIGVSGAYLGP